MEKKKIELTPDTEETNVMPPVPEMKTVADNTEEQLSVGTISEDMLNDEEKKMVDQFAEKIDISNVNQVVNYGIKAQKNISDFSVSILKKVKTYDLGEIGESLKELTVALDETTEPHKKGIRGLFQKAKHSTDRIRANYSKAETNVDRIEKDLNEHISVLTSDVCVYQQMYELNLSYYKELTMYIFAGKKALARAKKERWSELKAEAEISNKQEDVQEFRDFDDLCHRFEKKLTDLETTRLISIQTAPQIRMLQNNDREMLDKIQSSIANTIPLWRNQLVLSLGIEHTRRALDAESELSEKTNELLRKNSETLKMATIETAKAAERPIVDMETLRKCNTDLISSINEVVKIHTDGAIKREEAHKELLRLENELKQAMLTSGK